MKIYAIFKDDGSWWYFDHLADKPDNGVEITLAKLNKFIDEMNNHNKELVLANGKIKILKKKEG